MSQEYAHLLNDSFQILINKPLIIKQFMSQTYEKQIEAHLIHL